MLAKNTSNLAQKIFFLAALKVLFRCPQAPFDAKKKKKKIK